MLAAEILERLVAFPTVVGTPNTALMDHVAQYLTQHGARVTRIVGPEGDRENLFATIGDPSVPGYILSGHVDVVPAQEPGWLADPFVLRRAGDRLIGRGACDMKGFDAAVLAAVPALAAMALTAPVHIALSYDEEAGCRGVPHLLARLPELCAAPLGCIVGEPSGLEPVLAHKGKAALRLVARGVTGHSSRPDLGHNAIHALTPALAAAVRLATDLAGGPRDARFAPDHSTVQVGTVAGGQALNIIPGHAEACIEARAIPGVDPTQILAPLSALDGIEADWLSDYPALALDADHPLAALVAGISGHAPRQAVSYGTEAGLFQKAGVPSIVCGPGDIARAHKPEEYLTEAELAGATEMVLALGRQLC
ncbi:acetylornithine deacetylase [Marinibacterium profundimaris]|uniref:Acetylornithine deacetylase n=1 Tax=Marinibacterium profundimaris TaxID=1679460 RepID=A0A225NL62_9RHOB|nr:acetylornithine deacetylase [Marinibacterium profundimaris]OWU72801.1 acetylornithine deacetylase [Marinibacterium profundimaris]